MLLRAYSGKRIMMVVIEPRKQIEADKTPEEVQQMLADDIPIDADYDEKSE